MNKLVKNGTGYKIVRVNPDNTETIIAKLEKGKHGYQKILYSEINHEWFRPTYFSNFATLKDAKRYYEIH